jgi:hypothetical protein
MSIKLVPLIDSCSKNLPKLVNNFIHGLQQYYLLDNGSLYTVYNTADLDDLQRDSDFRESYKNLILEFDADAVDFDTAIEGFKNYVLGHFDGEWPLGGVMIHINW